MKKEPVKIKSIEFLNHDVLRIVTEKPLDAKFISGQATEIFLDKDGWENEGRPFTFTSLPQNDHLEFTIKTYPDHKGVTNELRSLKAGDNIFVNDIFGSIKYKGEGTFIAGGAGVTPFISILRDLKSKGGVGNNKLIFANKTADDIILKDEFQEIMGSNFVNILSKEKNSEYPSGHITEEFIRENANSLNSYFYVCGPPQMMDEIEKQLSHLNVPKEKIIIEEF